MIDMLHLIQFSLLGFSEVAFPVFVEQLTRPVDVRLRRPECNDFLRTRAAGEKLYDFAPVCGCAVTVLLQTALDNIFKFLPLCFQPASKLVGQVNRHLHVRMLPAWISPVKFTREAQMGNRTAPCRSPRHPGSRPDLSRLSTAVFETPSKWAASSEDTHPPSSNRGVFTVEYKSRFKLVSSGHHVCSVAVPS